MALDTLDQAQPETHAFQAEITQLLDIVIHSLYTDREIFVRELVSNAADALEKARHELLVNPDLPEKDAPLEIHLRADMDKKTIEFEDSGIGMTRDELIRNLGTIAHSGTKQFLKNALEAAKNDVSLIGQFGVGFYSAFMVAKKVTVETRSFHSDSQAWKWESDGTGQYTIAPSDKKTRGTRITLELKEDAEEFSHDWKIKDIVRKFSSFVTFPVSVQGEKINTVQAIWTRSKNEVTDEEYNEFFKFIANESRDPQYRLHFTADAPLSIRALLFVPADHTENLGLGRMEPGVDLYCRRVLIQKHPENLLPEWMRFVRGVVDSDDLPLNISRETMQDSALLKKLSRVITNRFIKFLNEEATKDAEKYEKFYENFGRFLKEGVTLDFSNREEIAKLLRYESSKTEKGKTISLTEYVARMKDGQKDIYYINGASREAIEAGPYVEALRERDYEVLYCLEQVDDFVFDHLREFQEKKLVSADRGDLDLPPVEKKEGEELSQEEADKLCGWMKTQLGDRIGSVRTSKRLVNNPAIAVTEGHLTATMQRLLAAMSKEAPEANQGRNMTLEINPRHPLIRKLNELRASNEEFAVQLTEQLYDNSLLAAGLMMDPRAMVDRLNRILSKAAGV